MKIDSSAVKMSSQHAAVEKNTQKETLRAWIGDRRPDFEGRGRNVPVPADAVQLSQQAQAALPTRQVASADEEVGPEDDVRIQILVQMLERLTGRKIKFFSLKDLQGLDPSSQENLEQAQAAGQKLAQGQQAAQQPQRAGWGVEYDYYESHYESEKTTFSAQGMVRTADGKEIAFNVDLSMSRQFMEENSLSLRAGDAKMKDPLVINFAGNAAQLTQTKFSFDIDSDGRADQISFVGPGSGFLALDKNSDGKINDGSELFGAKSGDGFGELAAYDSDGNRWIDENDAIYSRLRIWSKDENGQDRLVGLGQAGVGAIYLGNVSTDFTLKNAQNQTDGQIRSTGVYLNEDGTAGTIQKVDLSA